MSYKNTTKEERARKYNCGGDCYGSYTENGWEGICGNIDTCQETRKGEFFGTVVAAVIIVVLPIIAVVGGIIFLVLLLY